jgi:potassium efflux system protein
LHPFVNKLKTGRLTQVFVLLAAFLLVFHQSANAAPLKPTVTLIDYLNQEKTHLQAELGEAKAFKPPQDGAEFNQKMQEISAVLTMSEAKIQSLEDFLDNQKLQKTKLTQRLKHLQQLPLPNAEMTLKNRVDTIQTLLNNNQLAIDLINQNLDLAKQVQASFQEEQNELQIWKFRFDLEEKLHAIKAKKEQLHLRLQKLYRNNIGTNNQKRQQEHCLNTESNTAHCSRNEVSEYEAKIFLNNQRIILVNHELNALDLNKKVIEAEILVIENTETKTLQMVADSYKEAADQAEKMQDALVQMLASLGARGKLFADLNLQKPLNDLRADIKNQLRLLEQDSHKILAKLEDYQNQLKKLISSRQSLSDYQMKRWPIIFKKIISIPALSYQYLKLLVFKICDSYSWLSSPLRFFLWSSLVLTCISFLFLYRFLKRTLDQDGWSSLSGYLYEGFLILIQRNIIYLCLFVLLGLVFYFTSIPFATYQLLFYLTLVWFTFRLAILIARLVLLERMSDSSGQDVRLFYRLRWLLRFGGWSTALMVLSHSLAMSQLLQDLFTRVFMLFLLTVSLVTWKSREVIGELLAPLFSTEKPYYKKAASLLIFLVPVTLLTTAFIGLLGFVNLAWTMSRYQAYFLIVLVAYVLLKGLVADVLDLLSQRMLASWNNGLLWIEVFLKPFDKMLRLGLLLLSVLVLFHLLGGFSGHEARDNIEKIIHYSLLDVTGIHVTVSSVIGFLLVFALFFWMAKWTREFCYRRLYRKTKDEGVRNSLAVFTQYAIVLLGSLITLHVLGLDFSGMSMILGGLAVGMGFGLRDFANNIVGGIMLLIERPVREGDLIAIGEYEGQVAHIGIRSMRMVSWDNMQILIPNAETFSKPVTNWTHQDGIVRTVIPIKVSRDDDPVMVQQLILDVLAIIPEIVPEPPAQVFLRKITGALVEFEIRYFINVQRYSRVEIQSKVLFAITAQFKAAGIKPPVEPISVELTDGVLHKSEPNVEL